LRSSRGLPQIFGRVGSYWSNYRSLTLGLTHGRGGLHDGATALHVVLKKAAFMPGSRAGRRPSCLLLTVQARGIASAVFSPHIHHLLSNHITDAPMCNPHHTRSGSWSCPRLHACPLLHTHTLTHTHTHTHSLTHSHLPTRTHLQGSCGTSIYPQGQGPVPGPAGLVEWVLVSAYAASLTAVAARACGFAVVSVAYWTVPETGLMGHQLSGVTSITTRSCDRSAPIAAHVSRHA